ncbi:type II secretion system protein [Thalassotalea sp. G2M2-11]|uniref:type II secretion system protein n=1 Tax=Thalassotalea sp. G2M2-11 TaxID=2787627 RepID=UPI0019D0B569|nr:type II secretion system protein [Thalassotalea sp. G2M2-11]
MPRFLVKSHYVKNIGFTLIELMIVLSIVALLMTMVGPFALNIIDKTQAKQERLSIENWLRKVSSLSFYSGQVLWIEFNGRLVSLYNPKKQQTIEEIRFESLFFQPQKLVFNNKGKTEQKVIQGTFNGQKISLDVTFSQNLK